MRNLGWLLFIATLTTSHVVHADGGDDKHLTIMWAPIRLVIPVFEVTGEYAINQKLGVSVELGGGQRSVTAGADTAKGTELEGGAQVRYYVLGSFRHGMELGAEFLEEYVKFSEPLPGSIVGVAAGGATVGPFVGYKIATNVGFTFEAQLGARYLVVEPGITGQATGVAAFDKWAPLLHLNIGWSF